MRKPIGHKLIKSYVFIFLWQSLEGKGIRKEREDCCVAMSNAKSKEQWTKDCNGNVWLQYYWNQILKTFLSASENVFSLNCDWKQRDFSSSFSFFFLLVCVCVCVVSTLKKTKIDFFCLTCGLHSLKVLSAHRRLHWQKISNLTAQGWLPCQIQA